MTATEAESVAAFAAGRLHDICSLVRRKTVARDVSLGHGKLEVPSASLFVDVYVDVALRNH